MSAEALKFKQSNPQLNYKKMSLMELQKLPAHNGIIDFKISNTSFFMLNVLNDDSSVVKYFWQDSHDLLCLDLWFELSLEKGTFIDVGAHTGLYSLTTLKANKENRVMCVEPYFMNMSRLITNFRINGLDKYITTILGAASNVDGKVKFNISTEKSYLSKGGKIDRDGFEIDSYTLDNLFYGKLDDPLKAIKIDTEGEDYNVLKGSEELINEYKPKIIIEVREENKQDIQNFLFKYNYKIFNIENLNEEINLEKIKIDNISNVFAK